MMESSTGDFKARELVNKAEKKLKSFSLFSSSGKEEAVELFDKAAAQFKLNKEWDEAAKVYVRAAHVSEQLKNELEACNFYSNAAKCYKNTSPKDAIRTFRLAVQLHMESNRFSAAAKIYQAIAELEEKLELIPQAIESYNKAAECFFSEDSQSNAHQMLLKVAHFAARRDDYKKAVEIFEKVATGSLDNRLLIHSVKEYYFKAMLCHLCMCAKSLDSSPALEALEKYKDTYPGFDGSREAKLIEGIAGTFQTADVQKFTDIVFQYDRIYKLDNWTTSMLLDIKTMMQGGVTVHEDGSGTSGSAAAIGNKNADIDFQTGSSATSSASSAANAAAAKKEKPPTNDEISLQ